MLQVENEIGMLPVARDYSAAADAAFRQPVPPELVNYLVAHRDTLVPEMKAMWAERGAKTAGSWEELFGPGDAAALDRTVAALLADTLPWQAGSRPRGRLLPNDGPPRS